KLDDEYLHDDSDEVKKLGEGHYLVDGSLPIDELSDLMGFVPEETGDCETAGGLLFDLFGQIPEVGDTVSTEEGNTKIDFTIKKMDVRRIDKIDMVIEKREADEE
ncbi:MAG: transporter associated domain-containing protein, partial [Raoultibacter sp.]